MVCDGIGVDLDRGGESPRKYGYNNLLECPTDQLFKQIEGCEEFSKHYIPWIGRSH